MRSVRRPVNSRQRTSVDLLRTRKKCRLQYRQKLAHFSAWRGPLVFFAHKNRACRSGCWIVTAAVLLPFLPRGHGMNIDTKLSVRKKSYLPAEYSASRVADEVCYLTGKWTYFYGDSCSDMLLYLSNGGALRIHFISQAAACGRRNPFCLQQTCMGQSVKRAE